MGVHSRLTHSMHSPSTLVEFDHLIGPSNNVWCKFPLFLPSIECAVRWARSAGMAPNCCSHNQQAVLGWNCHEGVYSQDIALHTLHCHSPDCTVLLFLGWAISALVGTGCTASPGNFPLRHDEVSCCEVIGDICGLTSATVSHTSSEETENGEVGSVLFGVCFAIPNVCQIRQYQDVGPLPQLLR